MQLEKFKRKLSVALASVLTCTLIISFFNIYGAAADGPISSVGTQTPVMFAQFTDSSGQTADGNALKPGTYEMVLRVDDLASISQMQFTASYDPALLAFSDGSLPLASATGHSVSAYIGALAAPSDEYGSYPVTGAQVSVEVGGETVTAETDESGKFIFNDVPAGSYTATVSYKYGFTRTFTIEVADSDVESSTMVGIVACDWSKDSVINSNDKLSYLSLVSVKAGSDKYDLGVDIDRNGVINANDKMIYLNFVGTKSVDFVYHNTIISSAEVIQ